MKGRKKNIDEIIENARQEIEPLFNANELDLMAGLYNDLKEGGDVILKALMYAKQTRRKPLCNVMPSLDDYLTMLKDIDKAIGAITDTDAVKSFRCLKYVFCLDVMSLGGGTREFSDEQTSYREDFFNRRNDLPKDNIFRRAFVETYIDEEVYNRFYVEKEKEAGRYETEDEGEAYTPEGAKQWDKYFNDLCDEHNEPEYKRIYTDPTEFYPTLTKEDKLYEKAEESFIKQAHADILSFTS
jgi:hypothetical protein